MLVETVQEEDPASDKLAWSQFKPLRSADPEAPLPCNLIAAAAVAAELVITLSWSKESESVLGEK